MFRAPTRSGTGWRVGVSAVLLGLLAACGDDVDAGREDPGDRDDLRAAAATWFQPCPPAASAPPAASTPQATPVASPMPPVTLECFGRGDPVDLSAPGAMPTVVNVWASWCQPCRDELPVFQEYAERTSGTVRVLGVASADTRTASLALAQDLGVRFPTLWDEDASLMKALGRTALPMTLFIDPAGDLVHVYNATPLTEQTLSTLVQRHLGVAS